MNPNTDRIDLIARRDEAPARGRDRTPPRPRRTFAPGAERLEPRISLSGLGLTAGAETRGGIGPGPRAPQIRMPPVL